MLVLPDGSAVGSVGGGIMEYRTQQLARELLEPGAARRCRLAAFTNRRGPAMPRPFAGLRRLHGSLFAASGTGGMSHEA